MSNAMNSGWSDGRVLGRDSLVGVVGAGLLAAAASGQVIEVEYAAPTMDRWMYPFNATPGTRTLAATFGAPSDDDLFDDADGQFIVGYTTSVEIPAGLGTSGYVIEAATVRAWVANTTDQVVYDDSMDPVTSYRVATQPGATADPDPGRPIMLFGTGHRDGFTVLTFEETTPFSALAFPTEERVRRAFAATFDAAGTATDVSNFVKDDFEPAPWAIATTGAVAAGQLVPTNTEFVMAVNVGEPGVQGALRRGLDAGRLSFTVVSLFPAAGGPGGGSGIYPRWYCRENLLATPPLGAFTARLELRVRLGGCGPDLTTGAVPGQPGYGVPNGAVTNDDFFYYLALFAAVDPRADLTHGSIVGSPGYGAPNGVVNNDDFFYYLAIFSQGC